MRTSRLIAGWGVVVCALAGPPAPSVAQTQNSDTLSLTILDHTGRVVAPGALVSLPEGMETPTTVTFGGMGGLNVMFTEFPNRTISDYFHLDPYSMIFTSDPNPGSLPRRDGAILIPREAMETFRPVSVSARSDGNIGGVPSDVVTVTLGAWGAFPGGGSPGIAFTFSVPDIGEGPDFFTFSVPPMFFDIEEPPIETGDPANIHISDYLDIVTNISGYLLSSDNPADYQDQHMYPPTPFFVDEKATNDQELFCGVTFSSDVIPTPTAGSMVVVVAGLLTARRRRA
jgi:hypothetical protein